MIVSDETKITKENAAMNKVTSNIFEIEPQSDANDSLTGLLRQGARDLIHRAVQAELTEFLEAFETRRLNDGRQAVVRNGYHPERQIQTGIGPVTVQVPKVRSKDGKPVLFRSALVPPYVRKSRSLETALPWLYLKGISTGEMHDALTMLVGPEA